MFLAFGWMLIAGAMNTYRNASYAWDAAARSTNFSVIIRGGGPIQRFSDGSITSPPFQLSQSPAQTGPVWSNVHPEIWIRLGWSAFLILAATLGLAILWRHLSKPLSARAWARARMLAISAFTIYAGFHLYWFAIEML